MIIVTIIRLQRNRRHERRGTAALPAGYFKGVKKELGK
jgi:hypothetical protein